MTSILTNTSAMSALRTLRVVSDNLQSMQNQVSTGFRISAASDDAAYWSISTTMKSDNKGISAARDALGLGAAKVDTAYAGMSAVIDVLSDFKSKLVTASESSIDTSKVQAELDQLKRQVVSIAQSASFSGQNWLNTDIDDIYDETMNTASVVSAFVRGTSGVSVEMMETDLSRISLFNATGGGILQSDSRDLGAIGGLRSAYVDQEAHPASYVFDFTSPLVFEDGDEISFDMTVDADNPAEVGAPLSAGKTTAVEITKAKVNAALGKTDGTISDYKEYRAVLGYALPSSSGAHASLIQNYDYAKREWYVVPDKVAIVHGGLGDYDGSSMRITNLNVVGLSITNEINNGTVNSASGDGPIRYGSGRASQTLHFSPFTVYDGITVSAGFEINNRTQSLIFDREYVNALLGVEDGTVATAGDMVTLLGSLIDRDDVLIQASGDSISIKSDPLIDRKSGEKSNIGFYGASVSNEPLGIDFLEIDIEQDPDRIDTYLAYIDNALAKVVSGASILGSLQTRIDMQVDFATRLSDSIESGVSRLVDTDMEEASARLAALQTQEQLTLQSLQIANAKPQGLLRLFN